VFFNHQFIPLKNNGGNTSVVRRTCYCLDSIYHIRQGRFTLVRIKRHRVVNQANSARVDADMLYLSIGFVNPLLHISVKAMNSLDFNAEILTAKLLND